MMKVDRTIKGVKKPKYSFKMAPVKGPERAEILFKINIRIYAVMVSRNPNFCSILSLQKIGT